MDIIAWLESPEGERWSRWKHFTSSDNTVFRCVLMKVITDDGREETESLLWVV